MTTGVYVKRQHQGMGEDEVDALSEEELARRPEVRIINRYAFARAYVRIGLRGTGALALLWATVVLLGGFISVLNKTDFWYLTFIAFLQAARLSDAYGDDHFMFFTKWIHSLISTTTSGRDEEKIKFSKVLDPVIRMIFFPVLYFAGLGPMVCIGLAADRLRKQDYGSADGDASIANLKPALNLFYSVSLTHSAIFLLVFCIEAYANHSLVEHVSKHHGFSPQVLDGYFEETKRMCVSNPASTNWNLITYGTGLLDSELPEYYASGVRVVDMLIEQDIPVRQLLIRSPGHRIHKLLRALVWRSPVEGETRRLAARIVEHIAGDLNLAQFPGASECVFSLLDTSFLDNGRPLSDTLLNSSCHNNGDEEVLQRLPGHSKARRKSSFSGISQPGGKDEEEEKDGLCSDQMLLFRNIFQTIHASLGSSMQKEHVDGDAAKGTNEYLILQGLRILENLAHDQHNCTVIYNTKGLVSKIVAPVNSNSLTDDIVTNGAWIQVVDTSLKVVSRLMRAPGDTGREMRRQIVDSRNAVRNLEAVLHLQSSSSCILELQMRAMYILAQLFFNGSTSLAAERRKSYIERVLCIFCTVKWMEYYLAEEKKIKIDKETRNQPSKGTCADNHFNKAREAQAQKRMKEAMETANRLKEKAGEALAMLSMGNQSNSEAIKCFTENIQCLTEMLDSKTIKCKISATETVEVEVKIGCRISAAVILKHMCPHFLATGNRTYVKETTLQKVLVGLLHVTRESQRQASCTIATTGNDVENPRDGGQEEQIQSHTQQPEERKLQAVLLSLCANICAEYKIKMSNLATTVVPPVSPKDFVGKLTKMVEENSHATPACLAILKLTCQMITELILDNQTNETMETKKTITGMMSQVVAKLSKASKMMAKIESCMLFADSKVDYYGVPVKPLLSVLVKQAEEHLKRRKNDLGMNTPAAGGP